MGDAHTRSLARARRRRGGWRSGVRLVAGARRPCRGSLAGHLSRRALARPEGPSRVRPVEPAAAEGRRVPAQLALPHVLLLADLLLTRLPAPLRVLRRADLLPAHLPHPPA